MRIGRVCSAPTTDTSRSCKFPTDKYALISCSSEPSETNSNFLHCSTGYGHYIIARPKYYEIMLKQVPPHKVNFGKRVLDISEKDEKVTVHLANNETVQGDIVVGADGAYSVVRERLYEQLKVKGELPEEDQEELPFGCYCLVGQTKVLNPEEFPIVKEPISQFRAVIGREKPYSVSSRYMFTVCTNALKTMVGYRHTTLMRNSCFFIFAICSGFL